MPIIDRQGKHLIKKRTLATDQTTASTAALEQDVLQLSDQLGDHPAETNNPHNVTYAQTGADPAGAASAVSSTLTTEIGNHVARTDDPHNTTATQVSVNPNTISNVTASSTQGALEQLGAALTGVSSTTGTELTNHINNTSDPHNVQASQVTGLGDSATKNVGLNADHVAAGNHNHPTADSHIANSLLKHIPPGGAVGNILQWTSAGNATWIPIQGCLGCDATCTGTCQTGCGGTCTGGCFTTCTGGCGSNCSGSCSGSCSSTCQATCAWGCDDGYTAGSCFTGDTLVLNENYELIRIDEIQLDDKIVGLNNELNTVIAVQRTKRGERSLNVINTKYGKVKFTGSHPIMLASKQWAVSDLNLLVKEMELSNSRQQKDGPRGSICITNDGLKRIVVNTDKSIVDNIKILNATDKLMTIDDQDILFNQEVEVDGDEYVYTFVMSNSRTFNVCGIVVSGWATNGDYDYTTCKEIHTDSPVLTFEDAFDDDVSDHYFELIDLYLDRKEAANV